MSILFKCKCGALYSAQDSFSGEQFICSTCNAQISTPFQSDPNLCIVKTTDGKEYGPADIETVETWLKERRISLKDQVFCRGQWYSNINEVIQKPTGKVVPAPLSPPPPPGTRVSSTDAACPTCGRRWPSTTELCTNCGTFIKTGQHVVPQRTKEKKVTAGSLLKFITRLIIIVAICYVGYRYGVGPIINVPCNVVFENMTDKTFNIDMGPRYKAITQPGDYINMRVSLGMPAKVTATLIAQTPGSKKFTMNLAPGKTFIVNIDTKLPLYLMQSNYQEKPLADGKLCDELINLLKDSASLEKLPQVIAELHRICQGTIQKRIMEEVFEATDYAHPFLSLIGEWKSPLGIELGKKKEVDTSKMQKILKSPIDFLTETGKIVYPPERPNEIDWEFSSNIAVTIPGDVNNNIQVPAGTKISVYQTQIGINISMSPIRQNLQAYTATIPGTWRLTLVGGKKGDKYTWVGKWYFYGTYTDNDGIRWNVSAEMPVGGEIKIARIKTN